MYKLKTIPEDFQVNEQLDLNLDGEKYNYFILKKINTTTPKAIELISNALNARVKDFKIAGNKDSFAITTQFLSTKLPKNRVENLKFDKISLEYVGSGDEPISLGKLKGNEFIITVRNILHKPDKKTKFINFYGEQRFVGENVEIGKSLIKKDWKKVCSILKLEGNPVNQIQKLNPLILKLYLHAYQSWMWNQVATKVEEQTIPIIGFGSELDGMIKKEYETIMEEENINLRSFILRAFPEFSCEGSDRKRVIEIKDLKISELEDDEFGKNKKVRLSFFLPHGSYATVFIKELFSQN